MRPWARRNPHSEPPKDAEIRRWFQSLGPPPRSQAPPDLGAKVRARIEQQRARRGLFAWVPQLPTPVWGAVVATGLMLSLSLNVWWGLRGFGPRSSDVRQAANTALQDLGAAMPLRTHRFQVAMPRAPELGTFVAASPPAREPTPVVGFMPQAVRPIYFRIGTLYAEALAALHGGAREAAEQRLDLLRQDLASVQAPSVLSQYLHEMQTLLQSQRYAEPIVATFLALFEPLYEDAYASPTDVESLILFRAGTWLENISLAAAAGDQTALRQGGEAVEEIHHALSQLQAPRQILQALERLRTLTARQVLTDRDYGEIRLLAQDIQSMLSA